MSDRPDHTGSVVVQGTVTVQGTVNISGTVSVAGNVNITNSEINIATLDADNVVVDLLRQSARHETRATIKNDDDGVATTRDDAAWKAKVFSRGCRGFIKSLQLRLKNDYGAPGSKTDTSDTDFDAGTFVQTQRTGVGSAASVILAEEVAGAQFGFTTIGSTSYPTVNFGNTNVETETTGVTGYINYFRMPIAIKGTVKSIKLYVGTSAGNIRVAIYSESGGLPYQLQCESASVAAGTAGQWQEITLPTTYLDLSTFWIAIQQDNANFKAKKIAATDYTYAYQSYTYGPYPSVASAATSGTQKLSAYAICVQIKGFIKATKAVLSTSGNVSGLKFYAHASGYEVRVAIYDNASPKALKWQGIIGATSVGWNDIPISAGTPSSLYLDAGTYWVCWQVNTTSDVPSYTAGASGDGWYKAQTYGSYPATITGETSTAEKWSEYGYITGSYYATGNFTSPVIDTGVASPDYTTMLANCTVPGATVIKYQFKAATTSGGLAGVAFEGPTGPTDYFTVNVSQNVPSKWDGKRYCQYKFFLEKADNNTPSLDDITVNWISPAAVNLPVYLKPTLRSGPVLSLTVTVPAGQDGWVTHSVLENWNYDSCIIILGSVTTDLDIYYDTVSPDFDAYLMSDLLTVSSQQDRRYHLRLEMGALTVGDVPVSGIINNVQIPNVSNMVAPTGDQEVAGGATKEWLDVYGMGTLQWLVLRMYSSASSNQSPANTKLHIYVDGIDIYGGKKIYDFEYVLPNPRPAATAGTEGYTALPWGWYHLNPTTADDSVFFISYPIQFLKRLRITVENVGATAITYVFACSYQLVS
jgi:hypothetical protein